jgi:flavin reductase (DIM6/NTAB) family NADH-FMN oxidoreductase RutF
MRELAGGVAIVTVGNGEDITGFTATSVSSLSAEPPSVIVCVNQSSATWKSLQRYSHCALNFLSDADQAVANRFAGRDGVEGAQRFAGSRWIGMATRTPVLESALAALDCDVEELIPRHDHVIIVACVRAAQIHPGRRPLLFWMGEYHSFADE